MPKSPYKIETKERTNVSLYPSSKAKAKRLNINLSQLLENAIEALPEPKENQPVGEESNEP